MSQLNYYVMHINVLEYQVYLIYPKRLVHFITFKGQSLFCLSACTAAPTLKVSIHWEKTFKVNVPRWRLLDDSNAL